MVQRIGPDVRDTERRGGTSRIPRAEFADVDGLLYRLGRLQRVLVDVRGQVRELRSYASGASGARVDDVELTDPVVDDLRRRIARVEDALGAMRDDFDVVRDALDGIVEGRDGEGARVIALHGRPLPAGA